MTHRIIIDERGFLRCVHNDRLPLHELGTVKLTRLSHITPLFLPKRAVFRLLRFLFGDAGRVARWTRTWRCVWKVKMVRCGEWSFFFDRPRAVQWELDHIEYCDQCNISNPARWEL